MYEIFIVILVLLDQVSKVFMQNFLEYGNSVAILDGVFHLTYVENRGAAFGILKHKRVLFIVITFAVILFLTLYLINNQQSLNKLTIIAVSLLTGGAMGNLIDRIRLG